MTIETSTGKKQVLFQNHVIELYYLSYSFMAQLQLVTWLHHIQKYKHISSNFVCDSL